MKEKTEKNICTLVLWGLTARFILLWGVLDANFHSPIIQGLNPVPSPLEEPLAQRVYLFVADGLRFRTFIDDVPPYLRTVMSEESTVWGISHTRVPTESRPGNVAIAAGLYEDPSAIFRGWKENPVNFDSIFNQSSETWAWGSPDIVPMFVKGSRGNVRGDSYPHDWQDFDVSSESTIRLDSWVFAKFSEWLQTDAPAAKNKDKLILFFHLLGCDTAGHSSKPHSREYLENIRYVDAKIKEVVEKTESLFKPGTTTYVFTSDHGMTDWGSHGSGSTDETETPFIVWGAGIHGNNSEVNIEQADIAPLISTLLGISIPVNNEGILPTSFFNSGDQRYLALALLSNIKQLASQVKANRLLNPGTDPNKPHWRETRLAAMMHRIEYFIDKGFTLDAIINAEKAVVLAKESLSYFRRYGRTRVLLYLTVMWLGWIVTLFFRTTGVQKSVNRSYYTLANIALGIMILLLLVEHKDSNDWKLSIYGCFTLVSNWMAARCAISYSSTLKMRNKKRSLTAITGTLLLLAVMSAGLTFRWIFTLGMILVAFMQRILLRNHAVVVPATALVLAVFPSLPIVGSNPQIYFVQIALFLVFLTVLFTKSMRKLLKTIELTRLMLTALVCAGILDGRQWISWIILASTPISICSHSVKPEERIRAVVFALFSPLALLSSSYEPLFYLALSMHLLLWPLSSSKSASESSEGSFHIEDFAKMLYTLLCFFGTGNIASISSFDPTWTRHFITLFSPFVMFSLILLKISIPLMIVGCVTRALASPNLFLAVLLLGDCLSLPVMYCVTPQGSWLDIGSAISRFVIAITLPCLLLLLYLLSYGLMTLKFRYLYAAAVEKKHLV